MSEGCRFFVARRQFDHCREVWIQKIKEFMKINQILYLVSVPDFLSVCSAYLLQGAPDRQSYDGPFFYE